MGRHCARLVFAALALTTVDVSGAALDVYVLAGQSNMSGWGRTSELDDAFAGPQTDVLFHQQGAGFGYLRPFSNLFGPEISFGRTMAEWSERPVAIVKHALGSTSLGVDWNPDSGDMYAGLMQCVDNSRTYWAAQGYEVRIAGIVWMQGEEDAKNADTSAAYEANLAAFIPRIRDDLHAADVPFVYGQIRGKDYAFRDVVRAAQHDVDTLGIGAYLVETDDLATYEGLHFDTASHLALGRRFATAMIGLQSWVEGDADGNGAVDVGDLNAIRNNFGAWGPGDVTHDGLIGLDDLNAVRNLLGSGSAQPVPEPPTMLLLAGATFGLVVPARVLGAHLCRGSFSHADFAAR